VPFLLTVILTAVIFDVRTMSHLIMEWFVQHGLLLYTANFLYRDLNIHPLTRNIYLPEIGKFGAT